MKSVIDLQSKLVKANERIVELEAELKAAREQEPVATVDAGDDGYFAEILPDRTVKVGQQLYAAPIAAARGAK